MTEGERLSRLSLADRLRVAAVDLAIARALRALVSAVWEAAERVAVAHAQPPLSEGTDWATEGGFGKGAAG